MIRPNCGWIVGMSVSIKHYIMNKGQKGYFYSLLWDQLKFELQRVIYQPRDA
jgi:hypothetical protein